MGNAFDVVQKQKKMVMEDTIRFVMIVVSWHLNANAMNVVRK